MNRRHFLVLSCFAVSCCLAGCSPSGGDSVPKMRASDVDKIRQGGGPSPNGPGPQKATGWGHLKGRFVVTGKLDKLTPLTIVKDADYCGDSFKVLNETVVTGAGNELANVVVFLRTVRVNIHPSYEDTETKIRTLDNNQCRFDPHILTLRTTQTLLIKNSDPRGHNTKFGPHNPSLAVGEEIEMKIESQERVPLGVGCSIHDWMKGYLVIRDNPYMAVSGKDGSFIIKNLPAGSLSFQAWHERPKSLAVGDWDRGRFKVTIVDGNTFDLGTIEVPASLLNKN